MKDKLNILIEREINRIILREDVNVKSKIILFFKDNPNPNDSQVHDLANELGLDPSNLENEIYSLLSTYINNIGKHNDVPDSEFDPKELAMGIKVEMEHTDDPEIAKRIAKDHLSELKDYYTRLKKMEGE